jgi:hypothetical protein
MDGAEEPAEDKGPVDRPANPPSPVAGETAVSNAAAARVKVAAVDADRARAGGWAADAVEIDKATGLKKASTEAMDRP